MAYKTPLPLAYQDVFLDRIVVAAPATTLTFGSGGNGQFNATLNGDVDTTYILESYILKASAAASMSLEVNGATTNQFGRNVFIGTTGTLLGYAASAWGLGGSAGMTGLFYENIITARTGKYRQFTARGAEADVVAPDTAHGDHQNGLYEDKVTNITSLVIRSSVANAILAGSMFILRRRMAPA